MKVLKEQTTGLLLKSFILNNKDYLSITALHYFDLNNPEDPLKEASMWKECLKELNGTALDLAMPKPNAEVLVCGSCHNILENESASHVKLKVGTIHKELFVYGDRFWNEGQVSRVKSFKKTPLTYSNSFGGEGFSKNPTGKGYGNSIELPNIENPKALISSKDQVSDPAGFMPYDISWEQCASKLGTYDQKWKEELWPGFAADMDYTYFNVAPIDQQLPEYFKGAEEIALTNMHPEHPLLLSSIPELSIRCFTTSLLKDDEELFEEVEMRRDTLWLFPELQRGLVVFRGVKEVNDEEYSNIKYLNLKTLRAGEQPKSLDDVYELQKKELTRAVEVDDSAMIEAEAKIAEAKKEIFDIPRSFKESIAQNRGTQPTLKLSPDEKLVNTHEKIDKAIEQIQNSEEKLLLLKSKFSHISEIDTSALERTKIELLASKEKFSKMISDAKATLKEGDKMKQDALSKIEKIKLNPNIPDEAKSKIDDSFLKPKVKIWNDYAFDFLCESVKSLEKEPELLHKLRHLGLAKRTIKRSWFGYNPSDLEFDASTWALDDKKSIKISKGIVVPRFKDAKLIALRVVDEDKLLEYTPTVVLGSDKDFEAPLCYENENFPLFYFTSDIQARLCDQECYDICNTVVTDDITSVGDESKKLIENASAIFYIEEDGFVEKLPNAIKFNTQEYKDLFEMNQNSVEIRPEVLKNMPKNIAENFDLQRDVSALSVHKKAKKFTSALKDELKAEGKAIKDDLMAEKKKAIQKANATLKKHNLDPIDESIKPADTTGFMSASEVSKHFDSVIIKLKKQNVTHNLKIDDKIAQIEEEKVKTVLNVEKASQKYDDAQIKFANLEEKAKDPVPKWAKEMMLKAGIDPVDPHKKFTREVVIEFYQQNRSLAGKNLAHLDLSELQLQNIDLKSANITECDFSNTDLSGADLSNTIASKSKFTKTILNNADISNAVLTDATFEKVISIELKAKNALLDKTKIKESKFLNASLENAVFKESAIEQSNFKGSNFENASFLKATLNSSYFDDSKMSKTVFNDSTITKSQFQHIESEKMLFNNSKVTECNFSHSKLYNMRVLKDSYIKDSIFISVNMEKSSIFQASLKNCNFQQSNCSKMFIKKSSILKSDFRLVQAQKSRFEFNTFAYLNFSGLNMLGGSLRRTDLQECNLTHANLYGVEFFKVQLHKCNFAYANLENSSLENRLEFINEQK
ncbi:MAG: DUF2169 domain-containing protein [Helicobacteraceae bacterium]|nr:DUF2169 domain-containing protein [Helicobacteraceae bacterium]